MCAYVCLFRSSFFNRVTQLCCIFCCLYSYNVGDWCFVIGVFGVKWRVGRSNKYYIFLHELKWCGWRDVHAQQCLFGHCVWTHQQPSLSSLLLHCQKSHSEWDVLFPFLVEQFGSGLTRTWFWFGHHGRCVCRERGGPTLEQCISWVLHEEITQHWVISSCKTHIGLFLRVRQHWELYEFKSGAPKCWQHDMLLVCI